MEKEDSEERVMARASAVARASAGAKEVVVRAKVTSEVVVALAVHLVALVAACLRMVPVECRDSEVVCQAMVELPWVALVVTVAVAATLAPLLRLMVAWEIMVASQSVVRASMVNIERLRNLRIDILCILIACIFCFPTLHAGRFFDTLWSPFNGCMP